MEYALKNGKTVFIRRPGIEDAEQIIHVMKTVDGETPFLARNPGEFNVTVERERELIAGTLQSDERAWFVAEYDGRVVGQCSVGLVRSLERYRHRARVAFALLKDCWGLGIGGKMMEECLDWCRQHGVVQVELEVVKGNDRALRMYQGFGFEMIGTMPRALRYRDGTYADEYIMVKTL